MPALRNKRHEEFAQAVASGVKAGVAYERAGYRRDDGNAVRLTKTDKVKARIAELLALQASKSEISRDRLRQWCERIILAKPSEASAESDICEIAVHNGRPRPRIIDKHKAADLLSKICGYLVADKASEKQAGALADIAAVVAAIAKR